MSTIVTTDPSVSIVSDPNLSVTAAVDAAPRSLLPTGLVAGVLAAAAATAVALVAKAAGVPMAAAPRGAAAGKDIPMWGFAMGTLMSVAIGAVLAAAIARWLHRPVRDFVAVTVALTLVSFFGPITTGHATTATRLVLALTHVVAAAVAIPMLTAWVTARAARS